LVAITTDASIANVENITLAGTAVDVTLTGQTEAFTITGDTGANIIVSGSGADTIITGTGADQVTGAAGNDTITLSTGADADVIHFSAFATNGTDTITVFDTTEDHLNFDASMTGVTDVVAVTGIAAGAGDADFIDNEVYVYADGATASAGAGTATIANYTDLAQVAAFLSDAQTDNTVTTSNDTVAGDEAIFVINDLVANLTYAYHFKESGVGIDASAGATVSGTELTLLAIVTEESGAALVAADIT